MGAAACTPRCITKSRWGFVHASGIDITQCTGRGLAGINICKDGRFHSCWQTKSAAACLFMPSCRGAAPSCQAPLLPLVGGASSHVCVAHIPPPRPIWPHVLVQAPVNPLHWPSIWQVTYAGPENPVAHVAVQFAPMARPAQVGKVPFVRRLAEGCAGQFVGSATKRSS